MVLRINSDYVSLDSIIRLVFVLETECVLYDVRATFLDKLHVLKCKEPKQ
jgi:hypothetical protein